MEKTYWFINSDTKEYFEAENTPHLFDGDWIKRTPWPDAGYDNVNVQSSWSHQRLSDHCFYDYDLCQDGALVGLYYDKDKHTEDEINMYEELIRARQDVVLLFRHSLTRCESISCEPAEDNSGPGPR